MSVPVTELELTEAGLRLRVDRHLPATPAGPACLTVHAHPEDFTSQENHTFLGEVRGDDGKEYDFVVDRALADWSITGNKVMRSVEFLRKGRRLKPRLSSEAARRGQPVPAVHLR